MTWLFLALLQTANAAEDDGGGNGSWNKKPYWNPVVGGYAFNYNNQALYGLNLGAEVGLRYKQRGKPPKLVGRTRVLGVYTLGSNVDGYEVRLGSFMGPWLGFVGLETGPDFIYNQYSYNGFDIGDSLGVYVPLPQARMSFKWSNLTLDLVLFGILMKAVFQSTGTPQMVLDLDTSSATMLLHS